MWSRQPGQWQDEKRDLPLLRAQGKASCFPGTPQGLAEAAGPRGAGLGTQSVPPTRASQARPSWGHRGRRPGAPSCGGKRVHALGMELRQGTDRLRGQRRGPTLVLVSRVPLTLGNPAGMPLGVLFRAPHSGPGNAYGTGAWSGLVRTRAPPTLSTSSWSASPRNQTLHHQPPSPSPAHPRLLDLSQLSIPGTPNSVPIAPN